MHIKQSLEEVSAICRYKVEIDFYSIKSIE